jgi:DNA-binding CsgD family transcriptional regulator
MGETGMKTGSKKPPQKKLRCGECGAAAARNGNPFTASTLKVHQGRSHQAKPLNGQRPAFNLTSRQDEIMEQICLGITEAGIAKKLGLSSHTVHQHVRDIYKKLGLHNRAEAVRKWLGKKSRNSRRHKMASARSLPFCPNCGCHLEALTHHRLPATNVLEAGLHSAVARLDSAANRNNSHYHG